jgi:phage repressor protein C with HTH and peptisase S24 domain
MVQIGWQTIGGMSQLIGYAERFSSAMEESGKDIAELARALKLSYNAVKKVGVGTTNMMSAYNNARAAAILGVSSDWLATGEGLRERSVQQLSREALRVAAIYDQVSAKDRRHIDAAADAAASPDDTPVAVIGTARA